MCIICKVLDKIFKNLVWISSLPQKCQSIWEPGAIMISFFLERILRKVRSFWGSISLTVTRAFITSCWMRPAYWTVLALSRVLLMGIPGTRGSPLQELSYWLKFHIWHQCSSFQNLHGYQRQIKLGHKVAYSVSSEPLSLKIMCVVCIYTYDHIQKLHH